MDETSRVLSIIAYYLSEYDMEAVSALGFSNTSEAIKQISFLLGRNNNYLKWRRDEFDALPTSSSSRRGWANRPPNNEVLGLAAYLSGFSFQQLTEIVTALINNKINTEDELQEADVLKEDKTADLEILSESEIEEIINYTDSTARLRIRTTQSKERVYNREIITQLKRLYRGRCQLCGTRPFEEYGVSICEAHHIEYFSQSGNNDSNNVVIVCPNHHRLLHALNPTFDREQKRFVFQNGVCESLVLNYHI